eukprot:1151437-Pelagomonas_calceolata.AAC.5
MVVLQGQRRKIRCCPTVVWPLMLLLLLLLRCRSVQAAFCHPTSTAAEALLAAPVHYCQALGPPGCWPPGCWAACLRDLLLEGRTHGAKRGQAAQPLAEQQRIGQEGARLCAASSAAAGFGAGADGGGGFDFGLFPWVCSKGWRGAGH